MKKIRFLVLMLALCLSFSVVLSGCGDNVQNTRPEESSLAREILGEEKNKVIKVDGGSDAQLNAVTPPQSVQTDERAEFGIDITGLTGNVYDYEEVDVYGEFVAPSGEVLTVPAFYYKDYSLSLQEYDYDAEYALPDWYGNALGVFDEGDADTAGRGVVKIAPLAEHTYITQKSISLSSIDVRSTEIFFWVKNAGDTPVSGYYVGFYSDSTGVAAQYSLDAIEITDQWTRVSVPYEDFTFTKDGEAVSSGDALLSNMTAIKFFGIDEQPQGSILVKDFGVSRANGASAQVIDEFEVEALSQYIDTDKYNGYEVLTETEEEPSFRLRFNADEAGKYTYRITLKENGSVTAKYTSEFSVSENPTESKGVVKVEPELKRNFVYEDGDPFLAVGENVGWYTATEKKVYQFYDIFEHMNEAGMNWARVFMLDYQFALINYESGTINFDARQDEAYRLDKVIEKAEEEGIYIALVFLIHGQFVEETSVNDTWQSWNSNPFNVDCGGYLEKPWDFFTSERAKADFKKLARYIVARWGYSDHIFAWELWNEVNHLADYEENSEDSCAWHSEMASFIKGIDAFGHMVTSSVGQPLPNDPLHAVPELDYNNIHAYSFNNYSSALIDDYLEPMWKEYGKPVLISEIGAGGENADQCMNLDPNLVYITQSIWSGSFSGAGGGFTWWWEKIDELYKYDIYEPIRAYFTEVDDDYVTMPSIVSGDFSVTSSIGEAVTNEFVRVVGMKDASRVYAYMFDMSYNKDKYGDSTTLFGDTVLTFNGMEDGSYTVRLFDVREGVFLSAVQASAANGSLAVQVGDWRMDIAVLIEKN